MRNNLLKYFEYEKNNLEIKEGDFLRILNEIEILERKSEKIKLVQEKNMQVFSFDIRSLFEKVNPREVFAFSFGTAGFALAAFMFFINTQNQNTNVAQVVTISQEQIQDLRNKSKQTIDTIDKINSFDNLTKEEI